MRTKIGLILAGVGIWFGLLTAVAYPEIRAPSLLVAGCCVLILLVALGVRVTSPREPE